jgi:hypothetical protein
MPNKLRLARELTPADWFSLLEAWWSLAYFYFALRLTSMERLSSGWSPFTFLQDSRREEVSPRNADNASEKLASARKLHRLVGWAARLHLLPMACLVQALALRWMLRRRGIVSQVKIGVQLSETRLLKKTRGIHAHAWLEMDGEKVGESQDVDGVFRVLHGASPPGAS